MSDGEQSALRRARDALRLVPAWQGRAPRIVRSLGGGPSNDAWLVDCNRRAYVLRLDTDVTAALPLRRDSEARIAAAVGAAGIGPALEFALPERGLKVSRFVPGRSWTAADLVRGHNLERLGRVLRELHALPAVGDAFDLVGAIRHYAAQLGVTVAANGPPPGELAHAASQTGAKDSRRRASAGGASTGRESDAQEQPAPAGALPSAAEAASWADAACALLHALPARPPALCHNDLVAANVIDNDGELTLIDWEYAGPGDPLFDLAVVIQHHGLNATHSRRLLQAYAENLSEDDMARLHHYRLVYDYVVLLWLAVVNRHSPLQEEQQRLWSAAVQRVRASILRLAKPTL